MNYDLKLLKQYCLDYKECLTRIDQSYSNINSSDALIYDLSRRAFKADMVDLFKILEHYCRFVLKTHKISVSDMVVGESMLRCAQFGLLDKDLVNNIKKYKAIRDKYSHHYGKPSLENFISFYTNSRTPIYSQYKLMVGIYKKVEIDKSKSRLGIDTKQSNLF